MNLPCCSTAESLDSDMETTGRQQCANGTHLSCCTPSLPSDNRLKLTEFYFI